MMQEAESKASKAGAKSKLMQEAESKAIREFSRSRSLALALAVSLSLSACLAVALSVSLSRSLALALGLSLSCSRFHALALWPRSCTGWACASSGPRRGSVWHLWGPRSEPLGRAKSAVSKSRPHFSGTLDHFLCPNCVKKQSKLQKRRSAKKKCGPEKRTAKPRPRSSEKRARRMKKCGPDFLTVWGWNRGARGGLGGRLRGSMRCARSALFSRHRSSFTIQFKSLIKIAPDKNNEIIMPHT